MGLYSTVQCCPADPEFADGRDTSRAPLLLLCHIGFRRLSWACVGCRGFSWACVSVRGPASALVACREPSWHTCWWACIRHHGPVLAFVVPAFRVVVMPWWCCTVTACRWVVVVSCHLPCLRDTSGVLSTRLNVEEWCLVTMLNLYIRKLRTDFV